MAINFPTLTQLINKAKTGIKNSLTNSNPLLRNSFLESISKMVALRVYDFYYNLQKNVLPELFLTTAQDSDSIDTLVVPFSLTRNAATQATGVIIGTGVLTTEIPTDTTFQDQSGNTFISTADAVVINAVITITTLEQTGGIATAISEEHGLFTGISVIISGANETEYNGTFEIIVIDENTFSYNIDAIATSEATGVIIGSVVKVSVNVLSENFGSDQNLNGGTSLTITTPINSIDDTFYIQYPAFIGGTDQESDEALRTRGLNRYRNPSGHFTYGDIQRAIQLDLNNTRVWIQSITPGVGQVTVYFVRDNDGEGTAIIPSNTYLTEATNNIIDIAPVVFDYTNDLFVYAPTPIVINFIFTSITPTTIEMETAIINNLKVFFQERVDLEEDIKEIDYNSAIINTIDALGNRLIDFSLTNPSGTITIGAGELGILGSVSF